MPEQATIATVRGPVPIAQLGRTLTHEHIFVHAPELEQGHEPRDREGTWVKDAIGRMRDLRQSGIETIVDLTVYGLGRDIPRVKQVAAAVDLNIIVATGLYTYNELPLYLRIDGRRAAVRRMTEMFTGDLADGIADTGVRAAVLKCASDEPGITEGVRLVMRAVAQAQQATGAPVFTHSHAPSRGGLAQQDVLAEYGADLGHVVIGHSGDTTDVGYLEELIARGSYVGLDRFGVDSMLPTAERVDVVLRLCERGHQSRLLLSHDAVCHTDWYDAGKMAALNPNWHHLYLTATVLPMLRAGGLTDADLDEIFRVNVQRFLSPAG